MSVKRAGRFMCGIPLLLAALLLTAACATPRTEIAGLSSVEIDPNRQALALREAGVLRSKGARVWCVPYARNLSGVQIRGNANTWWGKAKETYARGKQPSVGAVMTFSKTRRLTMGHVAVVSEVISEREILVNHANWHRNKISREMAVIDVSDANDWSEVRLKSHATYGSVYPITGFIYPQSPQG